MDFARSVPSDPPSPVRNPHEHKWISQRKVYEHTQSYVAFTVHNCYCESVTVRESYDGIRFAESNLPASYDNSKSVTFKSAGIGQPLISGGRAIGSPERCRECGDEFRHRPGCLAFATS